MTTRKRKSKRRKDIAWSYRLISSCQFLTSNFFVTIARLPPHDMLPPICPPALWMRSHPPPPPNPQFFDRWFSLALRRGDRERRKTSTANHRCLNFASQNKHTRTHTRTETHTFHSSISCTGHTFSKHKYELVKVYSLTLCRALDNGKEFCRAARISMLMKSKEK